MGEAATVGAFVKGDGREGLPAPRRRPSRERMALAGVALPASAGLAGREARPCAGTSMASRPPDPQSRGGPPPPAIDLIPEAWTRIS
jgi:hypothetical protein